MLGDDQPKRAMLTHCIERRETWCLGSYNEAYVAFKTANAMGQAVKVVYSLL